MKNMRGFTLIELVMVILLTAVLALAGYDIMKFTVQHTFFLPNQMQAELVAADALETMAEGDLSTVHGLRFCKTVTAITGTQVNVTDQDGIALQFRLDTGTGMLYRKIGAAAETLIPYFMPSNLIFSGTGSGGALFTYYDGSNPEVVTAVPANVHRIQIDLKAQQGTGSVDKFEGVSQQSTSIKVY